MAQIPLDENLDIVARSDISVTIDPLTKDLNIIQKLDDEPNDVGGMSAQELKETFDRAGNIIKSYINDSLVPQCLSEGVTEQTRVANENQRKANETARQSAESARQSAESARVSAENARKSAESSRVSAENSRKDAESERASAENMRKSAESSRQTAESVRNSTESERVRQESERQSAENSRKDAESIRSSAESERVTAENARKSAESARADAEDERKEAEAARNQWSDYSAVKAYVPGNKVYYQGSSYVNTAACTGISPANTAHWQLIARRGQDGDGGGLSQDAADERYLQKTGGETDGEFHVSANNGTASLSLAPESVALEASRDDFSAEAALIVNPDHIDIAVAGCTVIVDEYGMNVDGDPVVTEQKLNEFVADQLIPVQDELNRKVNVEEFQFALAPLATEGYVDGECSKLNAAIQSKQNKLTGSVQEIAGFNASGVMIARRAELESTFQKLIFGRLF